MVDEVSATEVDRLLDYIAKLGCACDLGKGYYCTIHTPINRLRTILRKADIL